MIHIYRDATLNVTGIEHDRACDIGQKLAEVDNPVYEKSKRYTWNGQPAKGEPRKLKYWSISDGVLTLPLGCERDLLQILDEHNQKYEFHMEAARPTHSLTFQGTPRDYQIAAADAAIEAENGMIVAGTGTGKTVIAALIASKLQTPTLILTHTSTLLAQTANRLREFLGVEPGIIGGGTYKPAPLTVAMVQTLASRGCADIADEFGCVILDEAHHCPAATFAQVMQQFTAQYRFGLTATPTRADGLTPVLHMIIGPVVYAVAAQTMPLRLHRVETDFRVDELPRLRKQVKSRRPAAFADETEKKVEVDFVRLQTMLATDKDRNELIADTVRRMHKGCSLVVCERTQHVADLVKALESRDLSTMALTGSMLKDQKEGVIADFAAGYIDAVVATSGLVGEGFDLPRIDTVFVAAPWASKTKTQQVAGRCTRPFPGKEFGVVVDFVDAQVDPLQAWYWSRYRVYKSLA